MKILLSIFLFVSLHALAQTDDQLPPEAEMKEMRQGVHRSEGSGDTWDAGDLKLL